MFQDTAQQLAPGAEDFMAREAIVRVAGDACEVDAVKVERAGVTDQAKAASLAVVALTTTQD